MIALLILAAILFATTCLSVAYAIVKRNAFRVLVTYHALELAGVNRVGKWYENRVAELENESRVLAEQVIAGGSVVRHAMPIPQPDGGMVYLTDDTGLVVDAVKASEYHGE